MIRIFIIKKQLSLRPRHANGKCRVLPALKHEPQAATALLTCEKKRTGRLAEKTIVI